MTGTRGSTLQLGWLEQNPEHVRIRELLGQAVYVVWSYGTPIGFVTETEDGERTAYYVDESHSRTTSHHQGILQVAWGEYETIGEQAPRPRRAAQPTPDPGSAGRAIRGETAQQARMARLLDPRYADPDWTPEPLPERAEERDWARVQASQDRRYPSHP